MVHQQLQTIRRQIHELSPEQAKQLVQSGQMQVILEEYENQITEARVQAAMAYKKANPNENMEVVIQGQELAARAAGEVEQAKIMEELTYLYAPQETNPQTFTHNQETEVLSMEFPLGEVVKGVRWDNRPFVLFKDSNGVGCAALEDGNWVNSDMLIYVATEGAVVPLAEFKDWVSEINAS